MSPLTQRQHVDFGYDNQDAVIDVNIEMDLGDYLYIADENNSGGNTSTKRLLGLIKPASGEFVTTEKLKRTDISYLSQQITARKNLPATVPEVVLSDCLNRGGILPFCPKKEKEIVDRNIEGLGIMPLRKQRCRELSGGQQQRVLIARALCATNSLLVLDEPITGLDPTAIQEFYATIRRLDQGDKMAILMVPHDLRNAVEGAGKMLHLQKRVLFYGPAHDYMNSQAVGHLFHEKEQGRCRPTTGCHMVKLHMHKEEKS